jgi:hypothetical protein
MAIGLTTPAWAITSRMKWTTPPGSSSCGLEAIARDVRLVGSYGTRAPDRLPETFEDHNPRRSGRRRVSGMARRSRQNGYPWKAGSCSLTAGIAARRPRGTPRASRSRARPASGR